MPAKKLVSVLHNQGSVKEITDSIAMEKLSGMFEETNDKIRASIRVDNVCVQMAEPSNGSVEMIPWRLSNGKLLSSSR